MAAALPKHSYKRKSERYNLRSGIDIALNGRRAAYGTLIDISRDGVGFEADPPLKVGEIYLMDIRHIGTMSCKVVQNHSYNKHGGVLQISEKRKRELEARILDLISNKGRSARKPPTPAKAEVPEKNGKSKSQIESFPTPPGTGLYCQVCQKKIT